jgi:hypothetical protein
MGHTTRLLWPLHLTEGLGATSSDGGPLRLAGRKQKAVMDENTDPSMLELLSHCRRNLPSHLKERGYTAPKKGSQGIVLTSAKTG